MRNHLRREAEHERTMLVMLTEVFFEETKKVANTLAKAMREGELGNSEISQAKAYVDVGTKIYPSFA
jgi:hypothetical protein